MTLRDWKELMAVVSGKVDVLAFGHQGSLMEVALRARTADAVAPPRRMFARTLVLGTRRTLVLDADNSVSEKAYFLIRSAGGKATATVEHLA